MKLRTLPTVSARNRLVAFLPKQYYGKLVAGGADPIVRVEEGPYEIRKTHSGLAGSAGGGI